MAKKQPKVAEKAPVVIPGNELVQLATRVPKWMLRDTKMLAVQQGVSIMSLVQSALRSELERNEKVAA